MSHNTNTTPNQQQRTIPQGWMGKSVSLVLGGGGAKGLAHVGVIRYLLERGVRIRSVSGTSIGALVGGMFAAGKLDEYEAWATHLSRVDIVSLLDVTWGKSGLMKGDRIMQRLSELVGSPNIEDLPIKYTAVAVDLTTEKEIWLQKGSLSRAIRASISIPFIFTPVPFKNGALVDGGVLNPVPIAPTLSDQTDLIIAVNLSAPAIERDPSKILKEAAAESLENVEDNGKPSVWDACINHPLLRKWVPLPRSESNKLESNKLETNKNGDSALEFTEANPAFGSAYSVAMQSFESMQSAISRQKFAAHPPDILIDIPRDCCGVFEFDRAKEMVELGYQKAEAILNEIVLIKPDILANQPSDSSRSDSSRSDSPQSDSGVVESTLPNTDSGHPPLTSLQPKPDPAKQDESHTESSEAQGTACSESPSVL